MKVSAVSVEPGQTQYLFFPRRGPYEKFSSRNGVSKFVGGLCDDAVVTHYLGTCQGSTDNLGSGRLRRPCDV